MNYNDFPILSDTDYNFLNEKFNSENFERYDCVSKIYLLLNETKFLFYEVNNINYKLKKSLLNCKQNLQKLQDNLTATFTLNYEPKKEIKNNNLFSFINKIFEIAKLYKLWFENEDKEYYKKLALNSLEILFNSISDILTVLEKINIILFKHM